jgi:hypothetical protein
LRRFLRLAFGTAAGWFDVQPIGWSRTPPLLNDVRQFVCQQPPPLAAVRRSPRRSENHVPAHCISQRIHRPGRLRRLTVGMQANIAEVVPEFGLHEGTVGRRKRLAG